jgi:hypothetical protein
MARNVQITLAGHRTKALVDQLRSVKGLLGIKVLKGITVESAEARDVINDVSEATWEELEYSIARESNMTPNGIALMLLAGVMAWV